MSLFQGSGRRIEVIYSRIVPSRYKQKEISKMAYDLLRIAVSRICGADPASLTIGRTEHGKPFFVERRDIHFSISHAGEYILIAIGSEPLGVDIEQRRVISYEKIGRRIMTDPEYEAFLDREDREAEFYRKWVLMESYVKWTGLGMFGEIKGLPMNGWGMFLYIDGRYFAALRTEFPAEIVLTEYRREGNGFRKL